MSPGEERDDETDTMMMMRGKGWRRDVYFLAFLSLHGPLATCSRVAVLPSIPCPPVMFL